MSQIRVARKEHQCTERSCHKIMPGDRYVYAACPPWHEFARGNGKKWWIIKACLRCADEFGLHTSDTRKAISQ